MRHPSHGPLDDYLTIFMLDVKYLTRSISVANAEFDVKGLYDALDERRRSRAMRWAAVRREMNARFQEVPGHKPIAMSTITGLQNKRNVEGDGILQMLLWLGRTPESFLPGFEEADAERFRLPQLGKEQILRWDTRAIHSALNAEREARGMSWKEVANDIGVGSANPLTNLAKGGRTGFPGVMRIVVWLGRPAATFTRASDW